MFKPFFFYRVDISGKWCHFKMDQCSLLWPPPNLSHAWAGAAGKGGCDDSDKTFFITINKCQIIRMVQNSTFCMDFYVQMDKVQTDGSWRSKRKMRSPKWEKKKMSGERRKNGTFFHILRYWQVFETLFYNQVHETWNIKIHKTQWTRDKVLKTDSAAAE